MPAELGSGGNLAVPDGGGGSDPGVVGVRAIRGAYPAQRVVVSVGFTAGQPEDWLDFSWIAVWNVGLSGAKGIRTLQSISLTCGELHYSDQVILSGATRNRTRPKNCRDLRKARNLATRKYAKRRETTCGYAKGVDGINIMERGA